MIIYKAMQKIMFDDRFGLTQAVLNGSKTMTRRFENPLYLLPTDIRDDEYLIQFIGEKSIKVERCYKAAKLETYEIETRFGLGEKIAIAQAYWDLRNCDGFYEALAKADPSFPLECIKDEKGCHNKMFVKAAWMPHQIQITDIRIERLQDISEDDCLKEGIYVQKTLPKGYAYDATEDKKRKRWWFGTAKKAFEALINKVSGKGTWGRNPWVIVYSFELVK